MIEMFSEKIWDDCHCQPKNLTYFSNSIHTTFEEDKECCIANAIQHLLAVGYKECVSVGLTLWSACIATEDIRQWKRISRSSIN
jgi:hypothetical protein